MDCQNGVKIIGVRVIKMMSMYETNIFNSFLNFEKNKIPYVNITITSVGGLCILKDGQTLNSSRDFQLEGSLLFVISTVVEELYQSKLIKLILEDHVIVIKRSQYFIAYALVKKKSKRYNSSLDNWLLELLEYLDVNCESAKENNFDCPKIRDFFIKFIQNKFVS